MKMFNYLSLNDCFPLVYLYMILFFHKNLSPFYCNLQDSMLGYGMQF